MDLATQAFTQALGLVHKPYRGPPFGVWHLRISWALLSGVTWTLGPAPTSLADLSYACYQACRAPPNGLYHLSYVVIQYHTTRPVGNLRTELVQSGSADNAAQQRSVSRFTTCRHEGIRITF